MIKYSVLLFFCFCLHAAPKKQVYQAPIINHDYRPFGAGIILGAPSGLVGKYWLTSRDAIGMGFTYYFNDLIVIYGDYLYHFTRAFGTSTPFVAHLTPYVGIGGVALLWTSSGVDRRFYNSSAGFGLGVRVPLGLEWRPIDPPLGVFLELVPGIGIIPGTFGYFMGGIGIRYYF